VNNLKYADQERETALQNYMSAGEILEGLRNAGKNSPSQPVSMVTFHPDGIHWDEGVAYALAVIEGEKFFSGISKAPVVFRSRNNTKPDDLQRRKTMNLGNCKGSVFDEHVDSKFQSRDPHTCTATRMAAYTNIDQRPELANLLWYTFMTDSIRGQADWSMPRIVKNVNDYFESDQISAVKWVQIAVESHIYAMSHPELAPEFSLKLDDAVAYFLATKGLELSKNKPKNLEALILQALTDKVENLAEYLQNQQTGIDWSATAEATNGSRAKLIARGLEIHEHPTVKQFFTYLEGANDNQLDEIEKLFELEKIIQDVSMQYGLEGALGWGRNAIAAQFYASQIYTHVRQKFFDNVELCEVNGIKRTFTVGMIKVPKPAYGPSVLRFFHSQTAQKQAKKLKLRRPLVLAIIHPNGHSSVHFDQSLIAEFGIDPDRVVRQLRFCDLKKKHLPIPIPNTTEILSQPGEGPCKSWFYHSEGKNIICSWDQEPTALKPEEILDAISDALTKRTPTGPKKPAHTV